MYSAFHSVIAAEERKPTPRVCLFTTNTGGDNEFRQRRAVVAARNTDTHHHFVGAVLALSGTAPSVMRLQRVEAGAEEAHH